MTKHIRELEKKPQEIYTVNSVLGLTITQIQWMKDYFAKYQIEIGEASD